VQATSTAKLMTIVKTAASRTVPVLIGISRMAMALRAR
jgi:hypothetical protein